MGLVAVTDHVFHDLDVERTILGNAGHELRFEGNAETLQELRRVTRGADAILNCYTRIPNELLYELDGCRIIARYGIGLDTIDVRAATERGILITNVPDYCISEVSDHALTLILSLSRGIAGFHRTVRSGSWTLADAPPIHRIEGRTLGLVGFGRIAQAIARKAQAIGFNVIAADPFVSSEAMAAVNVKPMLLDELLSDSDVVSIHVPLTEETHHLIGDEQLRRMRPGAYLVNTSRGPLIDLAALRHHLETGHLGGAGLDVLESEPPDSDEPLLARDDVVITPHAAFYSEESLAELQRKAAEQVATALSGQMPEYAVNPEALRS